MSGIEEPPSKRTRVDEASEVAVVSVIGDTSASFLETDAAHVNPALNTVSYPFSGLDFSGSEIEYDSADELSGEAVEMESEALSTEEDAETRDKDDSDPDPDPDLDLNEVIADEMENSIEWANSVARNLPHPQAHIEANREYVTEDEEWAIKSRVWSAGPRKFLGQYFQELPSSPSPSKYMAALGCPLPLDFINKYGQDTLRNFMALAVYAQMHNRTRERLISPSNIDELCQLMEKAENIIVLSGAGISTSLGIPDFRSEKGLYHMLADLGLSDPQEVFDIDLFKEDPGIFFSIAKKILPETTKVSPTHKFIKLLQDKGKLLRNYTQNIDNLEHYAGIDSEKLVQCHGSFATATCRTCKVVVSGESIYPEIRRGEIPYCKLCSKTMEEQRKSSALKRKNNGSDDDDDDNDFAFDHSQGVLKPDITFFGEPLPSRFDELLYGNDGRKADLLFCIGTSLQVAPVSDILRVIRGVVPQVYINKTLVKHSVFDLTFLGACDDVVELLCERLNWNLDHEMTRRSEMELPADCISETVFPGSDIVYSPEDHLYLFQSHDSSEKAQQEKQGEQGEQGEDSENNEQHHIDQSTEEGPEEISGATSKTESP